MNNGLAKTNIPPELVAMTNWYNHIPSECLHTTTLLPTFFTLQAFYNTNFPIYNLWFLGLQQNEHNKVDTILGHEVNFSAFCKALYFWDAKPRNKSIPRAPTAKVTTTGMPMDSISVTILVLYSALCWRDLSAAISRTRLLTLSTWCIIWRCPLAISKTCTHERLSTIRNAWQEIGYKFMRGHEIGT